MRTSVQHLARAAALIASLALPARAQSALTPFDAERLRFTPAATDALLVDTGRVLDEGGFRLLLLTNYERGPLVLEGSDGSTRPLLGYRVQAWLAGAWSPVDRLELSARLPVIVSQGGGEASAFADVSAPAAFGLGTPELSGRYALLRQEDGAPLFLGVGLDVGLPGGTAEAFGRQGEWAGLQLAPRLAIGRDLGPIVIGASVGARIRSTQPQPGRAIGTELEQGVVVATTGDGLRAELALQAAESLVQPDVALELLAGVRLPIGGGFELHALGGKGFTDIPGTPSWRAGLGVSWAHLPPRRARPAVEPRPAPEPVKPTEEPRPAPAPAKPPEPPPVVEEKLSLADQRVLFALGRAELQAAGTGQLDRLAELLRSRPDVSLRIEGHTDNTGQEVNNRGLSQQRADAVRAYLIRKGIAAERLTAKGYGPERPLVSNDTREGRIQNRRVEFFILRQR